MHFLLQNYRRLFYLIQLYKYVSFIKEGIDSNERPPVEEKYRKFSINLKIV